MSEALERLRAQVGQLSVDLLRVLNERAAATLAIAAEKRRLGLPVRDLRREGELLDTLAEVNSGPFDDRVVRRLLQQVIDACVDKMAGRPAPSSLVGVEAGPAVTIDLQRCTIGGAEPLYIAGPCAVESEAQIDLAARRLAGMGVGLLRGGAFKPRTSPYSFQGLGLSGLELLRDAGQRYGLPTVSEATSLANIEVVARHVDVIQIGARNMHNYELLKAAGRTGRPVLLKRAFSATLDEWLSAAEYIAVNGSESIILCERGVRGFGRETRFTLDLSVVPLARQRCRLPVVVDVSHAAGRRDILAPLTRAAFAVGAAGVMLEVHPDPDAALSDSAQQLTPDDFAKLRNEVAAKLGRLADELGRTSHRTAA